MGTESCLFFAVGIEFQVLGFEHHIHCMEYTILHLSIEI